jgi:hypothetical protein
MVTILGRVYAFLGIVVFFSLIVVITNKLYIDSDLLAPYVTDKKERDKDDKQE